MKSAADEDHDHRPRWSVSFITRAMPLIELSVRRAATSNLIMNESIPNAPLPGEPPLNAEEQVFLQVFLALPTEQMAQYLRLLQHWERAPGPRKAIALKLLNAGLTGKAVAQLCGLSDRQLRRYSEYQAFSRLIRKEGNPPPRGAKGTDGGVEAYDSED